MMSRVCTGCCTLEDWTDVMSINMFSCAKYGYDGMEDLCVAPSPGRARLPQTVACLLQAL